MLFSEMGGSSTLKPSAARVVCLPSPGTLWDIDSAQISIHSVEKEKDFWTSQDMAKQGWRFC